MKRIINGVTYNTLTSTKVAMLEGEYSRFNLPDLPFKETLYQTRGGAFFIVRHEEEERKDEDGEWERRDRYWFFAKTRDEAEEWFRSDDVEILSDIFEEPPEAEAEASPAATVYVRVPASLKAQWEAAAREAGVSLNAWIMRCGESCLSRGAAPMRLITST